jgi:hypothetical protein
MKTRFQKIQAAIAGVIALLNEKAELQKKKKNNIWGKAGRRRIMENNHSIQKRRIFFS